MSREASLGVAASTVDLYYVDVRGQRKLTVSGVETTVDGLFAVTGDVNVTGTVTADVQVNSPSHIAEVGVLSQEITADSQLVTSPSSTWQERQQDGAGRRNDYLNSTTGTSPTFTTVEDAVRIRYHPNDYSLYWGDNTTATIGAAVTWDPVMDFNFSSSGHSVAFNADLSADNISGAAVDCTTVDATTSVTTNTIQQNATGLFSQHNSDGNQTNVNQAIASRTFQNFGATTGIFYHVRGTNSNDGYFRFDTTDSGGTYRTGTLTVGTATNDYVGMRTSVPAYPCDLNGNTRINGYLLMNAISAAAAPNDCIFRNSADQKFYIKSGGVAKLIVTSPVQ